jgi:hypothetical protein
LLSLLAISSILGLGLIRSPVIWDGLYVYWHLVLFVACVLAAPKNMRPVYVGAGLGLALNGAIVAAQYWGGWHPWNEPIPNSGLFFNKSLGSEMAALVIVGLAGSGSRFFIPLAAIPLITQPLTRGPLLALAVASAAWVWSKHRFAAVLLSILAVGLAYRLAAIGPRMFNVEMRLTVWNDMVQNLNLLGWGLGSFIWSYPWIEFAHNDFLQVLYELGIPGAVLFLGFFAYCLARGPLTERLVLTVFLVEGCFGFPLFIPGTAFMAGLAAGSILRNRVSLFGWQRLRQLAGNAGERRGLSAGARAV